MKRGWFQIHLSTAVVMMFTVSIGVALNLIPQKHSVYSGINLHYDAYGWPQRVCIKYDFREYGDRESSSVVPNDSEPVKLKDFIESRQLKLDEACNWRAIYINAAVILLIAILTVFILEGSIRRHEARKP